MQVEKNTVTEVGELAANEITAAASESHNALVDSFTSAFSQVFDLAPKVLAAVVVLAIGYVVARLVANTVASLSEKFGLQRAAERSGLSKSMEQAGVVRTVPQIVGAIMFWLLLSVFLVAAFDILDLPGVTGAIEKVVAYIPKVLVATVLVVIGLLLAAFLRGVIATSADRVGVTYAQQLASGCYYILALMTFIAAFEQLEITFDLLNYAILIAFGAVALALGLSFGLGGRDVMSGILCGYYLRQRFQAGDRVTVAGFEGTIREVGPVSTIVETDEDGLMNRHSIPNNTMLNEAVR
jgi:Mechanosensitive ion channel, conserved TM helix/Mechanosensitive ion channel, beta-domain